MPRKNRDTQESSPSENPAPNMPIHTPEDNHEPSPSEKETLDFGKTDEHESPLPERPKDDEVINPNEYLDPYLPVADPNAGDNDEPTVELPQPVPPADSPSWIIDPNATPLEKFISFKVPHHDDYGLNGCLMMGEFCFKCTTPAQYPYLDKLLLDCAVDD